MDVSALRHELHVADDALRAGSFALPAPPAGAASAASGLGGRGARRSDTTARSFNAADEFGGVEEAPPLDDVDS